MDTEQATNRLLFALSQHPGMTTAQLVEFLGLNKEQKKQVVQLLRGSGFAIEDSTGPDAGGPINNPARVWRLKEFGPSSPKDKELQERIKSGSAG
jgi:predicted ArsR family transcriptional regulator